MLVLELARKGSGFRSIGRHVVSHPAVVVLLLLVVAGCGSASTGDGQPSGVDPKDAAVTVDPAAVTDGDAGESMEADGVPTDGAVAGSESPAATAVTIEIVSFGQLQERIAAHKGKVVICDYWSTSCEPCVTELPHLVALRKKYPAEKLACVTASLDYEGLPNTPVESARDTALELLTNIGATTENVILSEDSLTVLDEKLKVASMPVVQIFGADGMLVRQFDDSAGAFTYADHVNPVVEQLLDATIPQPANE